MTTPMTDTERAEMKALKDAARLADLEYRLALLRRETNEAGKALQAMSGSADTTFARGYFAGMESAAKLMGVW